MLISSTFKAAPPPPHPASLPSPPSFSSLAVRASASASHPDNRSQLLERSKRCSDEAKRRPSAKMLAPASSIEQCRNVSRCTLRHPPPPPLPLLQDAPSPPSPLMGLLEPLGRRRETWCGVSAHPLKSSSSKRSNPTIPPNTSCKPPSPPPPPKSAQARFNSVSADRFGRADPNKVPPAAPKPLPPPRWSRVKVLILVSTGNNASRPPAPNPLPQRSRSSRVSQCVSAFDKAAAPLTPIP